MDESFSKQNFDIQNVRGFSKLNNSEIIFTTLRNPSIHMGTKLIFHSNNDHTSMLKAISAESLQKSIKSYLR